MDALKRYSQKVVLFDGALGFGFGFGGSGEASRLTRGEDAHVRVFLERGILQRMHCTVCTFLVCQTTHPRPLAQMSHAPMHMHASLMHGPTAPPGILQGDKVHLNQTKLRPRDSVDGKSSWRGSSMSRIFCCILSLKVVLCAADLRSGRAHWQRCSTASTQ